MKYIRRRKLNGQSLLLKRVTILIAQRTHDDLQRMKGTLGNSEAIEKLIVEKKNRMSGRSRARIST